MFQSPTIAQILDRLGQQKPVPSSVIKAQVRLRWFATGATALLLPCALAMVIYTHSWAWWVPGVAIFALALAGLIALGVAYAANRRHGVQAQWGMAPLSPEEMEEFVNLAAKHAPIEEVVSDAWLEVFVRSHSDLLGRDLVLLRQSVYQYEQALNRFDLSAPAADTRAPAR